MRARRIFLAIDGLSGAAADLAGGVVAPAWPAHGPHGGRGGHVLAAFMGGPAGGAAAAMRARLAVRLEKVFWLHGSLPESGMLDVVNLFNNNAEERISWQPGSSLRPLQVIPPRVARISVRVTF